MNVSDSILVTVAMAIYRPNIEWLKEELSSIAAQTYKHFQVYAWNDDPNDEYDYDFLFSQYLKDIPFRIYHGSQNLGSNKVFEKLTTLVETPYIAYCDQDDIWHSDKISVLVELLNKANSTLACSDMRVIDGEGHIICNKITDIRPRQTFVEGELQVKTLLIRNFVTGCTMIVSTDMAKRAIPFPTNMVHDHWLAFWNAVFGKIVIYHDSLIDYRLHGNNQTGMLAGIITKKDYYQKRSLPYYLKLCELNERDFGYKINVQIDNDLQWATKRIRYLKQPSIRNFIFLLASIKCNFFTTCFELFLPIMPQCLFTYILNIVRKGII